MISSETRETCAGSKEEGIIEPVYDQKVLIGHSLYGIVNQFFSLDHDAAALVAVIAILPEMGYVLNQRVVFT